MPRGVVSGTLESMWKTTGEAVVARDPADMWKTSGKEVENLLGIPTQRA
jgi:hypothetical protein